MASLVEERIAQVLSVLSHPTALLRLIPLIFVEEPMSSTFWWAYLGSVLIAPGLVTAIYLWRARPQKPFVIERQKRLVPMGVFLAGLLAFYWGFSHWVETPTLLMKLLPFVGVFEALMLFVTLFRKPSLHLAGLIFLFAAISPLMPPHIRPVVWVLMPPMLLMVLWARLRLRAHQWNEIALGAALGSAMGALLLWF